MLVVDLTAQTVTAARNEDAAHAGSVRLTPTEWKLLELLVRNPGKLITQRELLRAVGGRAYTRESSYLRVFMGQLRRKLEPGPSRPRHIITEPGMGYRFSP
jgi:two-component system KDP operon response regulator KdpE